MILLEPGHTQYDLHFRVLGIPVRVHPMFWLMSAIMGFQLLNDNNGVVRFSIWVACVFFSILIHEMGHVLMGRACGSNGKIVLYAFGGLAIPDRHFYHRGQRIAVSFAGPLTQFLFIGVLALVIGLPDRDNLEGLINMARLMVGLRPIGNGSLWVSDHELVNEAVYNLLFINLFWAVLNLFPIWPLDGGQISKDICDGAMPGGQGVRTAYGISLVVAGLLTIHCIAGANHTRFLPFLPVFGSIFSAFLFASLALQSWQLLQQERNPPWRREDW
jgi:stage IV sporulation protein FB